MLSHVREVAYKLQLPDAARIHLVFHVSQLKCSAKSGSSVTILPPRLAVDNPKTPRPEDILAIGEGKHLRNSVEEWLILWKSQPVVEATWENTAPIKDRFPNFCLEDKAVVLEGGIDRKLASKWDRLFKVYSRRPKHSKA